MRWFLAAAAVLAAVPAPAGADGLGSVHSENLRLIANVDTGPSGDIAFWGTTAVVAHGPSDGDSGNDGFWTIDISDPARPRKLGRFVCNDAGMDIAIWENLVFLAVQAFSAPVTCNGAGPALQYGVRIVSIADPERPVLVGSVDTCPNGPAVTGWLPATAGSCGHSHTLTLVPHSEERVYLYVNGGAETVIEVPLRQPGTARIVNQITPASLGADEGCHDFAVFMPRRVGVCALQKTRIELWDISDPVRPTVLSRIVNPEIVHPHSAELSWDGSTLVVGDEAMQNMWLDRCGGGSTSSEGALWFYDVTDLRTPVKKGFFQLPQRVPGFCTAHQFTVVPTHSGRKILSAAWIYGGTTVVDFTDPAKPVQLAHYIAEADNPARRSSPWASYWYRGHVFASNLAAEAYGVRVGSPRGLDVFALDDPGLLGDVIDLPSRNSGTQEALHSASTAQRSQPLAPSSERLGERNSLPSTGISTAAGVWPWLLAAAALLGARARRNLREVP